MPRPKSEDPKVTVGLSIRTSTRDAIADQIKDGRSVAVHLAEAVERKFGVEARAAQARRDRPTKFKGAKR